MTGDVLVADTPVDKPGALVGPQSEVRIRGDNSPFVGRGGDKLDAALEFFELELDGAIVVDVGSSTGGFTDCVLQRGAKLVYAVDVGHNQLDFSLRQDPRVIVMEQTNVKDLLPELFFPQPSFACIDVSFIGVRKILSTVVGILSAPFEIVILVKPQFELGPEYVSKGGVVRGKSDQLKAVQLVEQVAIELGLHSLGSVPSVLRGEKKGNQEYFLVLKS